MRLPDSRFSLTTEPERFNDLAWDLLLGAQEEARRWRHGEMDVEHLVLALLDEQRLRPLLNTLRLQGPELRDDLEDFCARQPTRSSNTLYVGDDLELLLDLADQERHQPQPSTGETRTTERVGSRCSKKDSDNGRRDTYDQGIHQLRSKEPLPLVSRCADDIQEILKRNLFRYRGDNSLIAFTRAKRDPYNQEKGIDGKQGDNN